MGQLSKTASAVAAAILLASCAQESPPPTPSPVQPVQNAAPAPAAQAASAVQAAEPGETAEARFVYDPRGLRDPFQPFIRIEPERPKVKPTAFVPQTPLQRFSVQELRVVGIVWVPEGRSKALIEDPQGKGYVVAHGTLVGDRGGRIVNVQPDGLTVEERFVDVIGEENVNVVTMKLQKGEGEVSP